MNPKDTKLFDRYCKTTEQTQDKARASLTLIGLHRWCATNKYYTKDQPKAAKKKVVKKVAVKKAAVSSMDVLIAATAAKN